MIVEFFLTFFINAASFFIKFMPSANQEIVTQISGISAKIQDMITLAQVFLPDNFAFVATSIIALEVGLLIWKASKWILHNITLGLFKK